MTLLDPDTLNPGVRRLVMWLRAQGFDTVDSGDGKTHQHTCDRGHPYVSIQVNNPEDLVRESMRLTALLREVGVNVEPVCLEPDVVSIQATYDPADEIGVIDLIGLTDEKLPIEA